MKYHFRLPSGKFHQKIYYLYTESLSDFHFPREKNFREIWWMAFYCCIQPACLESRSHISSIWTSAVRASGCPCPRLARPSPHRCRPSSTGTRLCQEPSCSAKTLAWVPSSSSRSSRPQQHPDDPDALCQPVAKALQGLVSAPVPSQRHRVTALPAACGHWQAHSFGGRAVTGWPHNTRALVLVGGLVSPKHLLSNPAAARREHSVSPAEIKPD